MFYLSFEFFTFILNVFHWIHLPFLIIWCLLPSSWLFKRHWFIKHTHHSLVLMESSLVKLLNINDFQNFPYLPPRKRTIAFFTFFTFFIISQLFTFLFFIFFCWSLMKGRNSITHMCYSTINFIPLLIEDLFFSILFAFHCIYL